jgi:hypothetical protein
VASERTETVTAMPRLTNALLTILLIASALLAAVPLMA